MGDIIRTMGDIFSILGDVQHHAGIIINEGEYECPGG